MTWSDGDAAWAEASGAGAPIRVVVVDDQDLVRTGFRMILSTEPDICVVGEARDGVEALALLRRAPVDVALIDIRMPRLDGIGVIRQLLSGPNRSPSHTHQPPPVSQKTHKAWSPETALYVDTRPRVIVLTTFDLDEYVYAALRVGASGFLLKDVAPEELIAAIRAVAQGQAVLAPTATRRLITHFEGRFPKEGHVEQAEREQRLARIEPLTAREIEVLTAVGLGRTNPEIASSLFMAETTVKTHIGRILSKLALRDRVQMVMLAYEIGLVNVSDGSTFEGNRD